MLDTKKHSILQECLVDLYLRLNGYFTTRFIIHSTERGKQLTEIDKIAVRFPKHSQKDRQVNCSTFLEIPNNIDILICEVKSGSKRLQFNKPLRNPENLETWEKLLNWIGLFSREQVMDLKQDLNSLVQPKENITHNNLLSINVDTDFGPVTIRPIIFSPERSKCRRNEIKYIHGKEILDFIWECLCPEKERDSCSTVYDLTSWGTELYPIVKLFKDKNKKDEKITNIKTIYNEINHRFN